MFLSFYYGTMDVRNGGVGLFMWQTRIQFESISSYWICSIMHNIWFVVVGLHFFRLGIGYNVRLIQGTLISPSICRRAFKGWVSLCMNWLNIKITLEDFEVWYVIFMLSRFIQITCEEYSIRPRVFTIAAHVGFGMCLTRTMQCRLRCLIFISILYNI
jgi:hypothetical protein